MEIRVLGCYGSELPGYRSSGFLINKKVLLDAGTVTSVLNLNEQLDITHILVSHSHFDHVKDILFLAGNAAVFKKYPFHLAGLPEILNVFKDNLLNNAVWPDFSAISLKSGNPVLNFLYLAEEQKTALNEITCEAVRVNHTIDATGFIISDQNGTLIYTGDTGPTRRIWDRARNTEDLKAVITEASFPNRLEDMAVLTGHLTPSMLAGELSKLGRNDIPVYVCHMKPFYIQDIQKELQDLHFPIIPVEQEMLIKF